jgi:hypothetical protein
MDPSRAATDPLLQAQAGDAGAVEHKFPLSYQEFRFTARN